MEERDGAAPAAPKHLDERGGRNQPHRGVTGSRLRRCVAGGRPAQEPRSEDKARLLLFQDERPVGKLGEPRIVQPPPARHRIQALLVQLGVHRVSADLVGVEPAPDRREADVVLATAESAGPMSCRERSRLVEEEELREEPRLQERAARPAPVLEPAGDPAPCRIPAPNAAGGVVQAAPVPVDETPSGIGDQLAERRHAVLERHRRPG